MLSHGIFLCHPRSGFQYMDFTDIRRWVGVGQRRQWCGSVPGLAYRFPFCNRVVPRVGRMLGGKELGGRQLRPQILFPLPLMCSRMIPL